MSGFFSELKRRRVFRSAGIYAVAAWGLAQVVDFVAERLFMPPWVSTITAIIFVVGFPVAIFLAWVFDIGPDGIRRTGAGSVKGVGSIIAAIAMLAGGTALIYAIVWPRYENMQDEIIADANSIAVLPFVLQGQTDDNEYLSDGIAEEILFALGTLTDFRVAARTSSFSFKDENKSAGDISRALNVRHIVEGSIRLAGDILQVRVSLIRGDTGLQLWSQRYEQPADNVFQVQEDIAAQIADAVRIEMGGDEVGERPRFRVQTENTEAYRLYLQGRFLWHQRGRDNIIAAVAFFEQTIELEPDFAAAWAGLASALTTAGTYGTGIRDNFSKAGDAARKAIELDDKLGEPYGTLAQLEMNAGNYALVEEQIAKGIALAPQNTTLRLWHATYLIQFGRALDANKQIAIALERDPAYPIMYANFGFSSFIMGNLDVAAEYMQKAWQLGVRPYFIWIAMFQIYIALEDFETAEAWLESAPPRRDKEYGEVESNLNRAWIVQMRDRSAGTQLALEAALNNLKAFSNYDRGTEAYILSSQGFGKEAADIVLLALTNGHYIDRGWLWLPALEPMRKQPEFSEIADAHRLTEYWREVEWPDKCGPDENDEVICFR